MVPLYVLGYARSGKDTAAEIMSAELGVEYNTSSSFCAEWFIYDHLKDVYGYTSVEECFEDRMNHREEWFQLICEYNRDDPARLSREIFQKHAIYAGLRNREELEQAKKELQPLVIWIDALERTPPEGAGSCTVTKDQADIIIENNGSLEDFEAKVRNLCRFLKYCGNLEFRGVGV